MLDNLFFDVKKSDYVERILMRLICQLKHPLQPRRLNIKLSNYWHFATTKIAIISVIISDFQVFFNVC